MPLDETINILVNKAFADYWFNKTYGLNLHKDQLVKLLEIATTNQLFQFDGQLNEQTDGVTIGSPLGPLRVRVRVRVRVSYSCNSHGKSIALPFFLVSAVFQL